MGPYQQGERGEKLNLKRVVFNSYRPIRSVGQNPKKNRIKKPVDLTSVYLTF